MKGQKRFHPFLLLDIKLERKQKDVENKVFQQNLSYVCEKMCQKIKSFYFFQHNIRRLFILKRNE